MRNQSNAALKKIHPLETDFKDGDDGDGEGPELYEIEVVSNGFILRMKDRLEEDLEIVEVYQNIDQVFDSIRGSL